MIEISALVDEMQTLTDEEVTSIRDRLEDLRRLTSGEDREDVIWALGECRDLLSPAGRLRRTLARAIRQ